MHAIWTGNIAFGLVSIPVKLVSAIKTKEEEHFSMFCGKHQVPLHYKRWCEKGEHDVAWDEVMKGMEVGRNKFFLFTKEKLDSLKPSKTETIEIEGFYPHDEIRTYWIDKHYFLLPGNTTTALKPYRLLYDALLDTDQIGLATFVMHERQHIAALQAVDGSRALFLTTLHYVDEINSLNDADEIRKPVKVDADELELAKQLIMKHAKKHIQLTDYEDTFAKKLAKLAHGKKVSVEEESERPEHKTLMDALKASVEK